MAKVRVLVVDDAVVVRRLISDTLADDPEIEVVGVAANGKIALSKIPQVNPDLVLLDMEMPEMDGLTTLKEIRKTNKKLPIIMFSTLTERGAKVTLDALAAGANDYAAKPGNVSNILESQRVIREELAGKIKALCGVPDISHIPLAAALNKQPKPSTRKTAQNKINAIVVGVSTGGPNALEAVIPALPAELEVPMLIVQHMPPVFTKSLADRLNGKSKIGVCEASEGCEIKAGNAYIAPGGYHLTVVRRGTSLVAKLNQDPPENSCRPAADVLFRSAIKVFGQNLLGVVMTGMGQDGLRGCQELAEAGGQIVVQDEATSVVWGMPGFVARSGLADKILPLDSIAAEIAKRAAFMNIKTRTGA
jgi:two-component system chemotaxis response regulator CheB